MPGGTIDWKETAVTGEHVWTSTSASGEICYVLNNGCVKSGKKIKCSACNITVHEECVASLRNDMKFTCRPTFQEVDIRQYRQHSFTEHHWVYRRSLKGKCQQCDKKFQAKYSVGGKGIAVNCSWCKVAYHNKDACFNLNQIGTECNLGVYKNIIVPPFCIIKLPKKGSFKSSFRSYLKSENCINNDKENDKNAFLIKSIPSANSTPVIVFINPRSGGNQGIRLLQQFQWFLNPRQVFDLTQGGPKLGLVLYQKVPNLRVFACGGDGTVGWILSVIDEIGMSTPPPVGILPLGTGNDLARTLGWGPGYADESISKLLLKIQFCNINFLDRWSLKVEKNTQAVPDEPGQDCLPLNVVNNYFSVGVDAQIALEFHEAREAHPEKFNSRLKNKMFYGQIGSKDLVKRKWRCLTDFINLECDGKDLTSKVRELRVHAILFLNIQSYGGGTKPWIRSGGTLEPSIDDGLIEVVGLTTYQLPLLQAGGHGTCIAQCKSAKLVTHKTIPMQVDGEACKLNPSSITLSLLNKAPMLVKQRVNEANTLKTVLKNIEVSVYKISIENYEKYCYDNSLLIETASQISAMEVNPSWTLGKVRSLVKTILEKNESDLVSFTFLDSCTAESCFRIDAAQEHLYYISDVCESNLYIIVWGNDTQFNTIEDKTATPSPNYAEQTTSTQNLNDLNCHREEIEFNKNEESTMTGSNKLLRCFKNDEDKPHSKITRIGNLKLLQKLNKQQPCLLRQSETNLHWASKYGYFDLVRCLLKYYPCSVLNNKDTDLGQTPLHQAAVCGCRNVCCMLIARGAILDTIDSQGLTPNQLIQEDKDSALSKYFESLQLHALKLEIA